MNLLYSLHYYGIAACPLNASFSVIKENKLRSILNINKSECFISFVSIGYPDDNFIVTTSKKFDLTEITTYH
jgi:hypothetical protein